LTEAVLERGQLKKELYTRISINLFDFLVLMFCGWFFIMFGGCLWNLRYFYIVLGV